MKNITVIGAGTMGNGIAHVFAMAGYKVVLSDISEDALLHAMATISKNLGRMVAKEKITEASKSETLSNITTGTEISKAVKNADLVIEAEGKENVLVVPSDAIHKNSGKTMVKVLRNGIIEEIEVVVGLEGSNDMAEIISGLNEGDNIIID